MAFHTVIWTKTGNSHSRTSWANKAFTTTYAYWVGVHWMSNGWSDEWLIQQERHPFHSVAQSYHPYALWLDEAPCGRGTGKLQKNLHSQSVKV